MSVQIHPTAIVESGARLGAEVELGAYAFVGAGVELGDGTRLYHHASVEGKTTCETDFTAMIADPPS